MHRTGAFLCYGLPGERSLGSSRKFWIGLGVSAALLAIFFLTADLGRLVESLAGANYAFLPPAIGLYLVSILFRTLRWQVLLKQMRPVSVARLYPVVVVGYMANNLLPMRLGELVRSYYVGQREGISKTSALVTIFIERLLDALTLLFFIFVIALFVPLTGLTEAFRESHGAVWLLLGAALAALFVITFGVLLLFAFSPPRAGALAGAIIRHLPSRFKGRLRPMVHLFLQGLASLRSRRTLATIFVVSMPVWLLEAGLFFLIGLSFGLHHVYDSPVEMAVAMVLVTSIANIGSSVPLGPGGLGMFEWVARETLVLLPLAAVDTSLATAYVAVVHASLLLPMIVLGQVFLWTQHVSLRSLSRAGRSPSRGPGRRPSEMASAALSAPGEERG